MATWRTPKTNWSANDYFEVHDLLRISGNVEYIVDIINDESYYYETIDFTPIYKGKGYTLSAKERNTITDTLEKCYAVLNSSWNRGYVAPRVDYGSAWNQDDLNTIEKMTRSLKNQLEGSTPVADHYSIYAGGEVVCGDGVSVGLL